MLTENILTGLSIIIVNYYKSNRVLESLDSIKNQNIDIPLEIIIIDNSCDDNEAANLSGYQQIDVEVTLIINNSNAGYTKACNQGYRIAKFPYLLLLNPDIILEDDDTLRAIKDFIDNNSENRVGVVGIRQLNDDGSIPGLVRRFPFLPSLVLRRTSLRKFPILNQMIQHYEFSDFNYNKTSCVPWLQSSFLVIKKGILDHYNGLDESYFLFMSDPDICYKSWDLDQKVVYLSSTTVKADGKRCSAGGVTSALNSKPIQYHIKDALIYNIKHILDILFKSSKYFKWKRCNKLRV